MVGDPARDDYRLTSELEADRTDQFQAYSSHLRNCGYNYSFLNNQYLLFTAICLVVAIWFIFFLIDLVRTLIGCKSKLHAYKAGSINFLSRMLYEMAMELCLCSCIYLFTGNEGSAAH